MIINVSDYWNGKSVCSICPFNFMDIYCEGIDKDRVIQELEEFEKNIQKMLDRLRKL